MGQITSTDVLTFFNTLPYNQIRLLNEFNTKNIFTNIYYQNKLLMFENSDYIEFTKDAWHMRPHLFCKERYGDQYQFMFPVILLLNNIGSVFDFRKENFSENIILTPKLVFLLGLLEHSIIN